MTEDFLYYLWKFRVYSIPAFTTQGKAIRVVDVGQQNTGSGPDFSGARIYIDDIMWAGNVEIHVKSSDWNRHRHQHDSAYDSVILHVVYEHDMEIVTSGNSTLEVFELKGQFDIQQYLRYNQIIASRLWIPCSGQWHQYNDFTVYSWLDRMLIERLEAKVEAIESILSQFQGNWEQAFYVSLARNFGFNVNSEAFEQLARSIPIQVLARYKDSVFQLEALLFGQASLLNSQLLDGYVHELKGEYEYLAKKHQLKPIEGYLWKFMRLRPVNFPTLRIAQFAQLIHQSSHLFSKVLTATKLSDLQVLFSLKASEYWDKHYHFAKKAKEFPKVFGDSSFDLVLINTIVPFLFVYGHHQNSEELKERAFMFLQHTKAESNSIIQRFAKESVIAHHAGQSQALLHLKNQYCSHISCLQCALGMELIRGNRNKKVE
jgi:hypothetical protein